MPEKPSPQPITYVKPEWKIRTSVFILLLVAALGVLLIPLEQSVQRPGGLLLISMLIQFACFFLIPLYVAGVKYDQPPQALGIQEKPFSQGLGKGISWGITLKILSVLVFVALLLLFPDHPQEEQMIVQAMLEENNSFELFGLVVGLTVLAPVGEEIFFRAFMMGAIEARFGRLAGVVISSIVFAALHENIWNFLPLFVGGCGFALLYAKYRDISLNIVAHSVWNGIAVILMFSIRG